MTCADRGLGRARRYSKSRDWAGSGLLNALSYREWALGKASRAGGERGDAFGRHCRRHGCTAKRDAGNRALGFLDGAVRLKDRALGDGGLRTNGCDFRALGGSNYLRAQRHRDRALGLFTRAIGGLLRKERQTAFIGDNGALGGLNRAVGRHRRTVCGRHHAVGHHCSALGGRPSCALGHCAEAIWTTRKLLRTGRLFNGTHRLISNCHADGGGSRASSGFHWAHCGLDAIWADGLSNRASGVTFRALSGATWTEGRFRRTNCDPGYTGGDRSRAFGG